MFLLQITKTSLVIGGCGFLGGHIVDRLLEKGHNVRVFDIRKTFENDKVEFIVGDLSSKEVCFNRLAILYYSKFCSNNPCLF